MHVQRLKRFVEREAPTVVKRGTTVLDPDTLEDSMDSSHAELKVTGQIDIASRESDMQEWLREFEDIMTKEPGLTPLTEFWIDTDQSSPITQHPYNTPLSLCDSVDKEIDWLLEKKYIRKSHSPWASPMVTVRKPDGLARLCADFKRINEVTTPLLFYMPRVEEVLEAVGRSRVISKMDLSKGYYQVPMRPCDIPKIAFVCHRGKYEFVKMPFEVNNAPAVLQSLMTELLKDCESRSSIHGQHCYI